MIPKRRTRPRMMLPKPDAPIRCDGHLKWVRGHNCVCVEIDPTGCGGRIEAAHVRRGTDGGIGSKPGDNWTLPACSNHHAEQHRVGEQTFEKTYKLSMKKIAASLWQRSPHRLAYERKQAELNATTPLQVGAMPQKREGDEE